MDLAAVITPHIAVGKVNIAAQWLRLSFASVFTSLYWSGGVCFLLELGPVWPINTQCRLLFRLFLPPSDFCRTITGIPGGAASFSVDTNNMYDKQIIRRELISWPVY